MTILLANNPITEFSVKQKNGVGELVRVKKQYFKQNCEVKQTNRTKQRKRKPRTQKKTPNQGQASKHYATHFIKYKSIKGNNST